MSRCYGAVIGRRTDHNVPSSADVHHGLASIILPDFERPGDFFHEEIAHAARHDTVNTKFGVGFPMELGHDILEFVMRVALLQCFNQRLVGQHPYQEGIRRRAWRPAYPSCAVAWGEEDLGRFGRMKDGVSSDLHF